MKILKTGTNFKVLAQTVNITSPFDLKSGEVIYNTDIGYSKEVPTLSEVGDEPKVLIALKDAKKDTQVDLYTIPYLPTIQTAWIDTGLARWTSSEQNSVKFDKNTMTKDIVLPYVSDGYRLTNVYRMFSDCPITNDNGQLDALNRIDLSNVRSILNMFSYCKELVTAPYFDTSHITNMESAFIYCSSLINVPLYNTSNVTNFDSMFMSCTSLKYLPLFDTSKATSMGRMLNNCYSLLEVPHFDITNMTYMSYAFCGCNSIKTIPLFDLSKGVHFTGALLSCASLETIPALDVGNLLSSMSYTFSGCPELLHCELRNVKDHLDFRDSSKLSRESLLNLFNNLPVYEGNSSQTITLHKEAYDRLTEEDKEFLESKNWRTFAF